MIEYTVKVNDAGDKFWYLNDQLHREDGPAVEYATGDKCWYLNGVRHREDGPAVEFADGTKCWWLNGIEYPEKEYWNQLKPVKELTVAEIESLLGYKVKVVKFVEVDENGTKKWYLDGKLHREYGPAIENADGSKSWWLNGIRYPEEEYWNRLNQVKELTVAEIEQLLGYKVKVVK